MPKKENSQLKGSKSIGRRISSFWETYSKWYKGVIIDYNEDTNRYCIEYDDGYKIWENQKDITLRPRIEDKEAFYFPEKIISRQKEDGLVFYQVKWYGYDSSENTWEPAKNLPKKMKEEFNKSLKSTVKSKPFTTRRKKNQENTNILPSDKKNMLETPIQLNSFMEIGQDNSIDTIYGNQTAAISKILDSDPFPSIEDLFLEIPSIAIPELSEEIKEFLECQLEEDANQVANTEPAKLLKPEQMSPFDVVLWIQTLELQSERIQQISQLVISEEINGKALLLMNMDDWKKLGVDKLGPLKVLSEGIQKLTLLSLDKIL